MMAEVWLVMTGAATVVMGVDLIATGVGSETARAGVNLGAQVLTTALGSAEVA